MILAYVLDRSELPEYSARPFAAWLDTAWGDFNEQGNHTNGDVIIDAPADWCGGRA